MDHHTVAAISIAGTCLDVIGSLYLAYDLLGGEHGPLRLLTRAVTYAVVIGVGYGLGLGFFFGLVAGVVSGVTIAIELNRAARGLGHYSLWWEGFLSALRALAFGACLYRTLGFAFAAAFAVLLTVGQTIAYWRDIRPAMDYAATGRPRITRRIAWAMLLRTLGYTATALLCSALVRHAAGCAGDIDHRSCGDSRPRLSGGPGLSGRSAAECGDPEHGRARRLDKR